MDTLRSVIFIDGRNLKYNLEQFKYQSDKTEFKRPYVLDEKHFHWKEFFEGVLCKFDESTKESHKHRLLRAYWYNAESIRPFEVSEKAIHYILNKYKYDGLNKELITSLAKEWYERERDYFVQAKSKIYEGIQRKVDFLEFRYTGEYVVQSFNVYKFFQKDDGTLVYLGTKKGEKGVDVGIAVDMIDKMPNYDVAILVSGDADFRPVVQFVKDGLKCVYQFSIAQGIPPEIKYLSPWLIGQVDMFQYFDELELLEKYLNRQTVPPAILGIIDKRVEELRNKATSYQGKWGFK